MRLVPFRSEFVWARSPTCRPQGVTPLACRQGVHYNFEIFHLREKNVPVDSMEIKEKIMAFAWEPVGSKFAIVTSVSNNNNNVSFYCVKSGTEPALLKTLEKKACNHLFWSPRGQHIILAGLLNLNGVFEFVDTK